MDCQKDTTNNIKITDKHMKIYEKYMINIWKTKKTLTT